MRRVRCGALRLPAWRRGGLFRGALAAVVAAAAVFGGAQVMSQSSSVLQAQSTNPDSVWQVADNKVVAASASIHVCYVTTFGEVWCAGYNASGALGDGTTTSRSTFARVELPDDTYLSAADPHSITTAGFSCVRTRNLGTSTDAKIGCWGDNSNGELGDGTFTDRLFPTLMIDSVGVDVVAGGSQFTCVLDQGSPRCTGINVNGELGSGTTGSKTNQLGSAVGGITDAISLGSGVGHSCVVRSDNSVWCWGSNAYGELGNGQSGTTSATPVQVKGVGGSGTLLATSVTAGDNHSCAVLLDDTVACWGRNAEGQLGNAATTDVSTPVRVVDAALFGAELDSIEGVSAGNRFTCAWKTAAAGGGAWCWGIDADGQLGDGGTNGSRSHAAQVGVVGSFLTDVVSIGAMHTSTVVAVRSDGTLWGWGDNRLGQLGLGTTDDAQLPVKIAPE